MESYSLLDEWETIYFAQREEMLKEPTTGEKDTVWALEDMKTGKGVCRISRSRRASSTRPHRDATRRAARRAWAVTLGVAALPRSGARLFSAGASAIDEIANCLGRRLIHSRGESRVLLIYPPATLEKMLFLWHQKFFPSARIFSVKFTVAVFNSRFFANSDSTAKC